MQQKVAKKKPVQQFVLNGLANPFMKKTKLYYHYRHE